MVLHVEDATAREVVRLVVEDVVAVEVVVDVVAVEVVVDVVAGVILRLRGTRSISTVLRYHVGIRGRPELFCL
eukprot:9251508-Heterocapsa_arctica.AAC.1